MKLVFVLSLMCCGVLLASAKSPKREIKDKIERYVKDGPVDLIVILDDSITAEKFGFNKGQRGAKIMTRIINNIKAIGDIPEGSRVGMVLVGEDLKYDDSVIKLGEFNTLQSNLERMTELQYSEDPTPTDLGYGLINAFWQLHSKFVVGRKMMIWLATNGSNKDGTNIRLIAKTLKNWGIYICTAAIGDEADKAMLRDISGDNLGKNCFNYFTDWEQYIDRLDGVNSLFKAS